MTLACRETLMTVRLILALPILVAAGCTKSADVPPPYKPVPAPPSPIASVPKIPIKQPGEPTLDEQNRVAEPVTPEKLVLQGSTWRAGAFTYTFQNGGHAIVKGGHLNKLSRSGTPGRYGVRGDEITITVMGRLYKARREDGSLFIGNKKAKRIDQENAETEP